MKTRDSRAGANRSSQNRRLVNPDNPNRLKPGAAFYITIEGRRHELHYPKKRGKLPLSLIRRMVDSVVATRQKPIFAK